MSDYEMPSVHQMFGVTGDTEATLRYAHNAYQKISRLERENGYLKAKLDSYLNSESCWDSQKADAAVEQVFTENKELRAIVDKLVAAIRKIRDECVHYDNFTELTSEVIDEALADYQAWKDGK